MKNLILALTVLLTTTITSQISKFNYIQWYAINMENPKGVYEIEGISGKAYHTYKPDSVIKNTDYYGHECIIFAFDEKKGDKFYNNDVNFFPIVHKEYTDTSIIYDCFNAEIEMKITYNEKENSYHMAYYFDHEGELSYGEALYTK